MGKRADETSNVTYSILVDSARNKPALLTKNPNLTVENIQVTEQIGLPRAVNKRGSFCTRNSKIIPVTQLNQLKDNMENEKLAPKIPSKIPKATPAASIDDSPSNRNPKGKCSR